LSEKKSEPEVVEEEQAPQWEGSLSSKEPLTSADGHETLTKDDLKARE